MTMRQNWTFKDGSCVKVLVSKGSLMEQPKENATCQVSIKMGQGDHFQCGDSEYLKEQFSGTFVVGYADCDVDRQIEKCVQSMVPNEECSLTISFKQFPSCIIINIVLLQFSQFSDIYQWTREEKLEVANLHKQKGVQLFYMGRLSDSFLRFNKAVKLVITINKEEDLEARTLYVQACNNMAWCHLKLNNTVHALTLCNKVLNVDPTNVKALLRRSEAYTKLKDTELAILDLRQVKKLEPNNGLARERLILLQHRLEIENIQYANVIKRMFQ